MSPAGRALARAIGLGVLAMAFAVTQPLVLIGVPLVVLLAASGPRNLRSLFVALFAIAVAVLGERTGLWWFERGWPLILGGAFVWVSGWRREWRFLPQGLLAILLAVLTAAVVFTVHPGAWQDLDTLMAARVQQALDSTASLFGGMLDDSVSGVVRRLAVALFPALLGVSSLAALGSAVALRGWLAGDGGRAFGRLRGFRFSDHLVWVVLVGLALVVAPLGAIADRIGVNALFFMGALYVVRGLAVFLSLVGGVSVTVGVVGGIVALLLYPLLIAFLAVALLVGIGDTWLDLRSRLRREDGAGR